MPNDAEALVPRDLTIPESGSVGAREVLSRAIRARLAALRALPSTQAGPPQAVEEYRAFRGVVGALLRDDPGAVASLLRHPTLAVLLQVLRARGPGSESGALVAELIATAALELAAAESLPAPLEVSRPPARVLCLPGRFSLHVPAGVERLRFESGRVTLLSRAGEVTCELHDPIPRLIRRPYHPVRGPILLATEDNNPLALVEAHPEKAGNAVDLGGRSTAQWVAALGDALDLVESYLPDLRREMDLFVQQIVPVGFDDDAHLSASYQEAVGTIYLTLHPRTMTMAEALIHEHSHGKLNAVFELDPLLENAFAPLYRSPVRPDPRPLHGVLLAVHAFLPVARLYERMLEDRHPLAAMPDFRRRYDEIVDLDREGAQVLLTQARPTASGAVLLDEVRRWIAHFAR